MSKYLLLGSGILFLILCLNGSHGIDATNSFLMSFWVTDTSIFDPPTLQDFQDCATLDTVEEGSGGRGVRIYVKNNAEWLWIAFRLKWTYSLSVKSATTVYLSIDGDHDGYWAEDCKVFEDGGTTDNYYVRGDSAIYPDVDPTANFYASWTKVDARSEQGSIDEQLIYFNIPLASAEYLYDLNIPNINNAFIGIGLLLASDIETIRFFGQSSTLGDSAGFLTIALASAGDVPAPDYGSGGTPSTSTSGPTTGGYTDTGYNPPMATSFPGIEFVILTLGVVGLISLIYRLSRRKR